MSKSLFAKLFFYSCISMSVVSPLCSTGRAIRPDAPSLGDPLFGPEMACVSTTACCPGTGAPSCSPIIISDTGAPQTISAPGSYCLATGLESTLTIDANSVDLNLNSQVVGVAGGPGIVIADGAIDVRVSNGFLQGDGGTSTVGITVGLASDIRLEDLACEGWTLGGIVLNGPQRVYINSVISALNGTGGLLAIAAFDVEINDSLFVSNTGPGALLTTVARVFVRRCQFNINEAASGLHLNGVSTDVSCIDCEMSLNGDNGFRGENSLNIELSNCVFEDNEEDGFLLSGATSVVVMDSVANSNGIGNTGNGFSSNDASQAVFRSCTATANIGHGFSAVDDVVIDSCISTSNGVANPGDGFRVIIVTPGSTALVRGCSATNNSEYGFATGLTLGAEFYSNVACGNTTANYFNVVSALFVGPNVALTYQNVDCTL